MTVRVGAQAPGQAGRSGTPESGFWFNFGHADTFHHASFSPGKNNEVEEHLASAWETQLVRVEEWLDALREEVTAPDLWGELERSRDALAMLVPEGVENTPFTAAEQEQIERHMHEVKEYVRQTHELTTAQLAELDVRLDYLVDAGAACPASTGRT